MIKKFILMLIAAITMSSCNSEKENKVLIGQLDEFMTGESKFFGFNGNVLVAEKGEILYQKSFGYADFKSKRLLNDSSVFEIASISKQFTATAILMLRDKGSLKLTDSLRYYFPELPYHGITLFQMLTHTSGLPEYENLMNDFNEPGKIVSNADMVSFLVAEKPPAHFPPGTRWEYNNTAYALLASIVEKTSGKAFKNFMSENIFDPLKMKHTRIFDGSFLKDTLANFADGLITGDNLFYDQRNENSSDQSYLDYLEGIQGAVAVFSTTGDLLKWDRSVKNNTLLSKSSQEEMLEVHTVVDTLFKSNYGYGVYLTSSDLGQIIYHSGKWPGYHTFLARNGTLDQTMIVLSNIESNARQIGMTLHDIINGKPVVMPYEHKEIALDSITLDRFIGRYKALNEVFIHRTGNKLYRIAKGKPEIELKPESETKFFYGDGSDRQIEFELDPNNYVVKAWFIGYGMKVEYQKL